MRLAKWPWRITTSLLGFTIGLVFNNIGKEHGRRSGGQRRKDDERKEGSDHIGYRKKTWADVVARGNIGIIHPQGTCKKLNDGKVNSDRPVNTLEGNNPSASL